jgi:hypothetical protein
VLFFGGLLTKCVEEKGRLLDFGIISDRVMDDEVKGAVGKQLSGNSTFLTRGNNRNKYWVPLQEALRKCQADEDFMLVASAKFKAYAKCSKVAVILAVHGKESIPTKVLSLHGANRLAIVQQGDVGALSLDETYIDLLVATLDEGTRACIGSSGLNEIVTVKSLGQFSEGFPFMKILDEITTGKSAGQFLDGFPFMRIFQEGQVPTDANRRQQPFGSMRSNGNST